MNNYLIFSDHCKDGLVSKLSTNQVQKWPNYCLPEAGDIVTLPIKSVSLVVAYSAMLFPKLFHSPALPGAPSITYHLSVHWHHSKRCVYFNCIAVTEFCKFWQRISTDLLSKIEATLIQCFYVSQLALIKQSRVIDYVT